LHAQTGAGDGKTSRALCQKNAIIPIPIRCKQEEFGKILSIIVISHELITEIPGFFMDKKPNPDFRLTCPEGPD
jgi:hypothetical protein